LRKCLAKIKKIGFAPSSAAFKFPPIIENALRGVNRRLFSGRGEPPRLISMKKSFALQPDVRIQQPANEAKGLLQLVCGGETVEGLRKLIGQGPERRAVLRAFDLLCLHLPSHPERQKRLRLRRRCNPALLSPELRAELLALLKTGMSQIQINEKCPVGLELIRQMSRQFRKQRRITPEEVATAEAMVRSGTKWHVVARTLGLSIGGLMKHTKYRKLRDRDAVFILPREKRDGIVEALRSGKSRQQVKHMFGVKRHTVDRLYVRHLQSATAMSGD
jgi:transposase